MRSGRMCRWNLLRGELMRRIILVFMMMALLLSLMACSGINAPEPDRCSLCDHIPSHAPCLVNLNTGEVGEIALYEPHHTLVGEIEKSSEVVTLALCPLPVSRAIWTLAYRKPMSLYRMELKSTRRSISVVPAGNCWSHTLSLASSWQI